MYLWKRTFFTLKMYTNGAHTSQSTAASCYLIKEYFERRPHAQLYNSSEIGPARPD